MTEESTEIPQGEYILDMVYVEIRHFGRERRPTLLMCGRRHTIHRATLNSDDSWSILYRPEDSKSERTFEGTLTLKAT